MFELSDAMAVLESLRYLHADLWPPNIVLDDKDSLKVIDFDSTTTNDDDKWGRRSKVLIRHKPGFLGLKETRTLCHSDITGLDRAICNRLDDLPSIAWIQTLRR